MEDTTKRIGIGAVIGAGVGLVLGAPALGVVALAGLGAGGGKAYDVYKGLPSTSGGGGSSGGGSPPPGGDKSVARGPGADEPTGRVYEAPKPDPTRPAGDMAGTRSKGPPVIDVMLGYLGRRKLGGTADYPDAVASAPLGSAAIPGDADKTIDQLPDGADSPTSESSWAPFGLRTGVREMIGNESKWVHDPPGWLGTGSTPGAPAHVFGRLRALGYANAADQVIWTYLHTGADASHAGGYSWTAKGG